jgi:hypothetical protein
MNIGEANNVQQLLGWLLDPHASEADGIAAGVAAAELAERARAAMGAGRGGPQVAREWGQLLTSCAGCALCLPSAGAGCHGGGPSSGGPR